MIWNILIIFSVFKYFFFVSRGQVGGDCSLQKRIANCVVSHQIVSNWSVTDQTVVNWSIAFDAITHTLLHYIYKLFSDQNIFILKN